MKIDRLDDLCIPALVFCLCIILLVGGYKLIQVTVPPCGTQYEDTAK